MKRSPPNSPLDEAVRDMGRSTTPRELHSRGVRRLRSVSLPELSQLIERAVNQALLDRTAAMDDEALDQLVERAQKRMLDQLERKGKLRDRWRRLAEARAELEEVPTTSPTAAANDQELVSTAAESLHARLRTLFREESAPLPEHLEQAVVEESCRIVTTTGRRVSASVQAAKDQEISLLHRRVEKLLGQLDDTERALGLAMEEAERTDDLREESLLDASLRNRQPSRFPQRQLLLRQIFEANQALLGFAS